MKGKLSLVLAVVFCFATVISVAQEQTGSIFGTVKNKEDAIIAGAKIVVKSPSLIRPLETNTNDKGVYVFPALPVGLYDVYFSAEKYKDTVQKDIPLTIGSQLRINATLEVGVVGEEIITVTGETPLVDVKSTDTGMSITKEMFAALPKGRNFTSIVALAPGANDERVGDGLMIDGATAVENVWVIDGVDITNMYTGKPTQTAVFEFIEEVQVRSGGYEAEFGGSMGGVINVVTRSGGNEFHGEGTIYIDSQKLEGDVRKSLRINPIDNATAEYVTWLKDKYSRYELGGALGGYVLKDRVWFFGSYLPVFHDITRSVPFRDAKDNVYQTTDFDQARTTHQASFKVSSQVTGKLRVSGSYSNDWYKELGSLPLVSGTDNPVGNWPDRGSLQPGYDIAASADYMLTDNMYASFKGGYHYDDNKQLGGPDEIRYQMADSMLKFDLSGIPEDKIKPNGWNSITSGLVQDHNIQDKMNWSGDLTYFADMGGNHMFKGGLQYFRIHNDTASTYLLDWIQFFWDQTYVSQFNPGVGGRGTYGYYVVQTAHPGGRGTVANVASSRYAIFLQDSWGVTPKLTVNIGLRAEKEEIPSYSDISEFQYPPIKFGFADKLVPRLGVAYDFFGTGKLKLFGNVARYYDVMKLAMAIGSYGGFKWRTRYFALDTLEWWTIGGPVGQWPRSNNYPGTYYDEADWRIPSFETTDPGVKPTGTDEYILGADYQLADNLAVNARFVYKNVIYAIEDVGVIGPGGEEYYITNPGYGWSVSKKVEAGLPGTAKAIRHYWAFETRFTKRFSNNWSGGGSLTLSRLTGNYSGLGSTDEYGRADPNVERYFDLWFMDYDSSWNLIDGAMPTDRLYALKLYGQYSFSQKYLKGLTVGIYQTIQQGTPLTTALNLNNATNWQAFNRNDLGRTPTFYQTDLYAEYNFDLAGYKAQVSLNVANLFDQKIPWRINNRYDRDNPKVSNATLLSWFNANTPINWDQQFVPVTAMRRDPRYGMDNFFQSPMQIRLGFKFYF
jgi:hypothetical protein